MNISDMESGQVLYLEDLKELYADGSVDTATKVKLAVYRKSEEPGIATFTDIVSGNYYGNFDGTIGLDFSKVLQRQVIPVIPFISKTPYPKDNGSYISFKITAGGMSKEGVFNIFSKNAKTIISDMDYLAISEDTKLIVNFHSGEDAKKAVLSVEMPGIRSKEFDSVVEVNGPARIGIVGTGIYSLWYNVSELPVDRQPFRIAVTIYGENSVVLKKMYSCVYECMAGDFQQYIFAGRLGGYVSFPMSGSLEMKTESEYENAGYGQSKYKVHSTHSALMTQYSGGLTKKTAAVLADLLSSDWVYHLVNGEWRRIVIEEADTTIVGEDSLQFCSFKFRYAEDVPVREFV